MGKLISRREFLQRTAIISAGLALHTQDKESYLKEYGPIHLIIDQNADSELQRRLDDSVQKMYAMLSQFPVFNQMAVNPVNVIGYASDEFVHENFTAYNTWTQDAQGGSNSFSLYGLTLDGSQVAVNLENGYWNNPNLNKDYFFGTFGLGTYGFLNTLGHAMAGSFGESWEYAKTPYPNWFVEFTAMSFALSSVSKDVGTLFSVSEISKINGVSTVPISELEGNNAVGNAGSSALVKSFIAGSLIIDLSKKETVEPILQILADMGQGISFDDALYTQTGMTKRDFYSYVENFIANPPASGQPM